MRRFAIVAALAALLMVIEPVDLDAQRGGGRGGFGGGARGGARGGAAGGGFHGSPSFGTGAGRLPQRPPMGGGSAMQRPVSPQRPGGGSMRPSPVPAPRPGGGNISRPGQGGGGISRPDRPGGIQRPPIGGGGGGISRPDRPGGGDWNRPGGRPGINTGNINAGNRWNNANINRNIYNNFNRPYFGYHYHHGDWYHGYCNHWWNRPWFWGGAGFAAGAAFGWLMAPGQTIVYANPYYVPVDSGTTIVYNYSEPIPIVQQETPPATSGVTVTPTEGGGERYTAAPPPDAEPSYNVPPEATANFDAAREAFKKGDFAAALGKVDAAIKVLPSDGVLHEFRALVLFAMKRYTEAAATLYAVLAAGPGWDWETMKALYADQKTYTDQLRTLETFISQNPRDAAARFVLAYHYLTMGYTDQARQQYEQVVKLQPDNQLAAQLVKALAPEAESDRPAIADPKAGS